MELLWVALPMAGCALMMVVMMRMMAAGHERSPAPSAEPDRTKEAELEAEAAELRARLGERDVDAP